MFRLLELVLVGLLVVRLIAADQVDRDTRHRRVTVAASAVERPSRSGVVDVGERVRQVEEVEAFDEVGVLGDGPSMAKRIDETLIFAVAPVPSSFPFGGVVAAAGVKLQGTDALDAIDKGLAAVEGRGSSRTGSAPGPRSAVRCGRSTGRSVRPRTRRRRAPVYGLPVAVTPAWNATVGDAIVGDWQCLVIGVREDIRYDMSDSAILTDGAGAIIANAFQDDLVALRCFMRMGAAIGRPVATDGTPAEPFSLVDWTA